jgi:hypothetical protein
METNVSFIVTLYLDTLLKGKNEITKDIMVKIAAGSQCYYGLQHF